MTGKEALNKLEEGFTMRRESWDPDHIVDANKKVDEE